MTELQEKRVMRSKAQEQRRAAGKCHECKDFAIPGTVRCDPCTKRNRERVKDHARRLRVFAWRPIDHAVGTDE